MYTLVKKIERLDSSFVSAIAARRRTSLTPLMKLLTHLGDGPLWVILAFILFIVDSHGTVIVVNLAMAFAIELSIYKLSKSLLPRLRPYASVPRVSGLVVPPDEYSFPSGHTAAAFVMVTVLSAFAPLLSMLLLPLAIGIGFSRMYLGVHYPTDVLAGAALGLMSGKVSLWIFGVVPL